MSNRIIIRSASRPLRPAALLAAVIGFIPSLVAAPPLPVIPSGTFDVTAAPFSAVGDGARDNTTAIQAALNAARTAGGGTVEIPAAAAPYRCGPITIYSNTNLQIDAGATLQALPFGTYPNSNTSPSDFIVVYSRSTNVEISGSGTIDGNGSAWWTAYNSGTIANRPRLIRVNSADTVLVTGVTLLNSPSFHIAFSATNNFTADGLTITSPSTSPNTDGIDPAGQHYVIKNCSISVGDDNIAVKAGSIFCGDITVTNCAFGTGHGVSIGGQTNAGLDGMIVDSCTFNGTTTALRLKADPTQGGPVTNVTYSNLTLTNVQYPFVFYSYYRDVGSPGAISGSNQTTPAKVANWNASPPDSLASSTLATWSNITLSNITSTGSTGYAVIWGLPLANALISNVTLNNVRLSGNVGLEIYNAANVQFTGNTRIFVPASVATLTTYNALVLTTQPQSQTIAPGGTATFSVATAGTSGINGTAPTFQWTFNGTPLVDGPQADGAVIAGSATPTLTITNVQPAEAGAYAVKVSNALDTYNSGVTALVPSNTATTVTSATAQLAVTTTPSSSLINVSVRCGAGAGDQTLSVGFTVLGQGKPVLIRGIGPQLAPYNVSGFLPDPVLSLYGKNGLITTNDNWGSAATAPDIVATAAAVQAFGLPDGSLDSALLTRLDEGVYSIQITGKGGATGVALAEVYDAAKLAGARLINVSVRAFSGTGDNALNLGFVIDGSGKKKVLIRAVGPTLSLFSVSGLLADPFLTVKNQSQGGVVIATNNDWGSASTSPDVAKAANDVSAFGLPDGSKDAALLLTLDPGVYAAVVSGADGGTGVALVEVYEVP